VVVLVVLIVLVALGVHSCDVSQTKSALQDYNNGVYSIIQSSDSTGRQVFHELASGGGASSGQSRQNALYLLLGAARRQLSRAQGLGVPDQMQAAERNLVLALRMRSDGIGVVARQIQPALGTTTNRDAINQIAGATARFYASDVIYKAYTVPEIAGALNGAGITVGVDGQTINGGQFLPALGWLQPAFIASQLGVHLPGTPLQPPPTLDGVAVGTNTMVPGATNHVTAKPAPTFTISVTNNTHQTLYNIGCSVSLAGLSDTGSASISELAPGQGGTCQVTLSSSPTPGLFNVTATVSAGAGTRKAILTFPVQFL
jgi:hypothetical protein